MKKVVAFATPMVVAVLLFSCKMKNNAHEHGPDTHTHDDELVLLGDTDYFGDYSLEDAKYGTKTKVTLTKDARIMVTNSLPDHATGVFPNEANPNAISAQNRTFSFPLHPKFTGKATWIREPGIALNGIKFEPGTGEVVVCESGENYRIEALQDLIDLGLDDNHAHVQPTGAYQYHGTPTEVIKKFDTGEDLVHVGFAHDGFPMYYSKSNAYKPSFTLVDGIREGEDCTYTRPGIKVDLAEGGHHDGTFNSDYEYVAGSGDLDECNGITIDGQYMYLVTNDFPYVGRCLMGEFESQERGGGGHPNHPGQNNESAYDGQRRNG
ncbi:MAG: YHYH protein, partial [Flavobacteriaceae bacterium]